MKLKVLEEVVLTALQENEKARQDDFILIGAVWKRQGLDMVNTIIGNAFLYHNEYGLATPESITRCRRKILEKHPEYAPEKTKRARNKEQDKYIKYNRGEE